LAPTAQPCPTALPVVAIDTAYKLLVVPELIALNGVLEAAEDTSAINPLLPTISAEVVDSASIALTDWPGKREVADACVDTRLQFEYCPTREG
jgi:hypothetical protein